VAGVAPSIVYLRLVDACVDSLVSSACLRDGAGLSLLFSRARALVEEALRREFGVDVGVESHVHVSKSDLFRKVTDAVRDRYVMPAARYGRWLR
jgi:hypothetical protein